MPIPSLHHAPSQYITQGSIGASSSKVGEVQSVMEFAKIWDLIDVRLLKSTMNFESSYAHLLILAEASRLWNKSYKGWFVTTIIL